MLFERYPDVLSIEDLMEMLDIGKHTAYALLLNGDIKAFKLGGAWKIPRDNVNEYMLNRCSDNYGIVKS